MLQVQVQKKYVQNVLKWSKVESFFNFDKLQLWKIWRDPINRSHSGTLF